MIKNCLVCRKEFYTKISYVKKGNGKYCSQKCMGIIFKGKHSSPKTEFQKGKHSSIKTEFKKGKKSAHWKGGKYKAQGYIFIYMPNHPFSNKKGYIREHRLVIEKHIGRYLLPKEKCHHLRNKTENIPNLLMAFKSESAHQRFHHNPLNVKPEEIIFDGRNPDILSAYKKEGISNIPNIIKIIRLDIVNYP